MATCSTSCEGKESPSCIPKLVITTIMSPARQNLQGRHVLHVCVQDANSCSLTPYCVKTVPACREEMGLGYMPMRPSDKERSPQSGYKFFHWYAFQQHQNLVLVSSNHLYMSKLEPVDELSLDAEDLLSFSFQVAKGMEYITSKNVGLSVDRLRDKFTSPHPICGSTC